MGILLMFHETGLPVEDLLPGKVQSLLGGCHLAHFGIGAGQRGGRGSGWIRPAARGTWSRPCRLLLWLFQIGSPPDDGFIPIDHGFHVLAGLEYIVEGAAQNIQDALA